MSELLMRQPEQKLWFDGPNYTTDAVIIDPDTDKILLIQRRDTGEWALPGGFVDENDASSYHTAVREANEEAGVTLSGHAPLIFRGIVDDPRNSERAWIETNAHLFTASSTTEVYAADDAVDAAWHDLAALPPLYASHRSIIERALDHMDGDQLINALASPDSIIPINGGHMEYDKHIFEQGDQTIFAKRHVNERFTDPEKAERSLAYLEKEAFTMAHLRQHGFNGLPEHSTLHIDALVMNALQLENGWHWRTDASMIDAYINDALQMFSHLQTVPPTADTFDIEPSYESFRKEGWVAITEERITLLNDRLQTFFPRLSSASQTTAHDLLARLPELRQAGVQSYRPEQFVFCHHDVRQSNLAWHPEYGSRLVDWSWAGLGVPNSDITSLLIDLHKSGFDTSSYNEHINSRHCLTLMGFWLNHCTWPHRTDDTVRFQQFVSALSAYELLQGL